MMREQGLQGFEHVSVAQIPRRARAVIHDAVIAFGIGDQAGVLYRVEEPLAVVGGIGLLLAHQILQRAHDVALADRIAAVERSMPIGRRVRLPRGEAAVTFARNFRRRRIDFVEIFKHEADRRVEAVEIETVEGHPLFRLPRGIMLAQPIDEGAHFVIAPHPDREAGERRPFRRRIFACAAHNDRCGRRRANRPRWR